jgi:hypothetical protein
MLSFISWGVWGVVNTPQGVNEYGVFSSGGLGDFIANIIKLLIIIGGIYAVFNFILAGYAFMSAGGDAKKVADAWGKIYQSIIGLIFVTGAFVIGAIVSNIFFGDTGAIFNIQIFGP